MVAEVTNADVPGAYKVINHGKDISAQIKLPQAIRLNADGTVSGALAGTWIHSRQQSRRCHAGRRASQRRVVAAWNTNANKFVVTFSAQNTAGVSIWGARTED